MTKTYLDLSILHLTSLTMRQLHTAKFDACQHLGWPAMTIAPYEYGVFISVPSQDAGMSNVPADLHDAIRHAQSEGAEVIRFDVDGCAVDSLTTHEWS